jgi:2-dehydro-3-deoxyphosphogluconate aldolase/(4S)-4-hydroxy-2-oxoglutarate aldolase
MLHSERIENTQQEILRDGVILCVRLGDGVNVLEACRAAIRGGLRVLEITLTTPGALDVISELGDEALVGAGTVLSTETVIAAASVGAQFVFSPTFDANVVDEATMNGVLAVPGATTPTEILRAHRHGARLVKVFPAGALGGPDYLRAIRGPLPDVAMIPTSGPTAETIPEYLAAGAIAVGVGAEVFHPGFTPESVEAAARRVRAAMDKARGGLA